MPAQIENDNTMNLKHINIQLVCCAVIFCLFISTVLTLKAQTGTTFGINKDYLVKVNLETAELEPFFKLNLPEGASLKNLVYIPKDTAFYSTIYSDTSPSLLRIDHSGKWKIIGQFKVDQRFPDFCKALTYNSAKDELILSVSLDGNKEMNDTKAEALTIVNRETAICKLLATIRQLPPPDDFEEIAIYKNQLFCFDGDLEKEVTYVFPFKLNQLKGELFCGSKQSIPLFTMGDVLVINQVIYFSDSKNQRLYYFNLIARKWFEVDSFHGPAELGGILVTGLALVPLSQA